MNRVDNSRRRDLSRFGDGQGQERFDRCGPHSFSISDLAAASRSVTGLDRLHLLDSSSSLSRKESNELILLIFAQSKLWRLFGNYWARYIALDVLAINGHG